LLPFTPHQHSRIAKSRYRHGGIGAERDAGDAAGDRARLGCADGTEEQAAREQRKNVAALD